MPEPRDIQIKDAAIRLGQFLKLADLAGTGADAKALLESGGVTVNGVPETRRGRQLAPGDLVETWSGSARVARTEP